MSKLEDAAFGLSRDELQQIRYLEILKRRKEKNPGKKFSDKLSLEAQIAMQQAMEDMETEKVEEQKTEENGAKSVNEDDPTVRMSSAQVHGKPSISSTKSKDSSASPSEGGKSKRRSITESVTSGSESNGGARTKSEKRTSFSELYRKNGSTRMHQDITDEDYSDDTGSKQALGGGKLVNAMEIIEFVNHENPSAHALDDDVIDELARINSVEKCEVWMQATYEGPLASEVFEQREFEAE